jgi:hypothetical protein
MGSPGSKVKLRLRRRYGPHSLERSLSGDPKADVGYKSPEVLQDEVARQ